MSIAPRRDTPPIVIFGCVIVSLCLAFMVWIFATWAPDSFRTLAEVLGVM